MSADPFGEEEADDDEKATRMMEDEENDDGGAMGAAAPERTGASLDGWLNQSVVAPAFRIRELKGSVGAGDATVGGFLASMLRGLSLAECCRMACATGAASVEGAEAADEIPTWGELRARVEAGWATLVPGEDGPPDEKL